ncbi:Heat shock protein beta6like [Caligus rogercresseyi]|uniref:Heat shock protein beta6like n=1 Tax=Caligus rogercresseyi TaxID=217165 RepID=A0A7T8JVI7_CALRO|nr:Heat shock protein beta6like [Caligus rogercresseyi]
MDVFSSPTLSQNTTTTTNNNNDEGLPQPKINYEDDKVTISLDCHNEDDAKVVIENDTYKILLDVSAYKPEELVIKTLDNSVHIKAKHEEKTSDGRSSSVRQFSKSYTLPKGVNPESVVSSLSKEGVLTVSAPLPTSHKLHDAERLVPIKHT